MIPTDLGNPCILFPRSHRVHQISFRVSKWSRSWDNASRALLTDGAALASKNFAELTYRKFVLSFFMGKLNKKSETETNVGKKPDILVTWPGALWHPQHQRWCRQNSKTLPSSSPGPTEFSELCFVSLSGLEAEIMHQTCFLTYGGPLGRGLSSGLSGGWAFRLSPHPPTHLLLTARWYSPLADAPLVDPPGPWCPPLPPQKYADSSTKLPREGFSWKLPREGSQKCHPVSCRFQSIQIKQTSLVNTQIFYSPKNYIPNIKSAKNASNFSKKTKPKS
mgnify:CR=1 FL=1